MEWINRDPFHSVQYAKDSNVSRRYYFSDMDIKEIMIDADIYYDFSPSCYTQAFAQQMLIP